MKPLLNLESHFGFLQEAVFLERVNRFVGLYESSDGSTGRCHISDTGRLKEILTFGRKILISSNRKGLKTDSKLVAAKMDEGFILLNTSIHSKLAEIAIRRGVLDYIPGELKREVKFGNSRIDFLLDNIHFLEVKGCNLRIGDTGFFPDAPTTRGKRHVGELIDAVKQGYEASVLFIVMRDVKYFSPNFSTDPEFSKTLMEALRLGIGFKAVKIKVAQDFSLVFSGDVPLKV